jgi:putative ABC transport system permease protein
LLLILGRGGKPALLGVAIGLAAALGLTRLMTSLLYGVGATDPLTFAGGAVLLSVGRAGSVLHPGPPRGQG